MLSKEEYHYPYRKTPQKRADKERWNKRASLVREVCGSYVKLNNLTAWQSGEVDRRLKAWIAQRGKVDNTFGWTSEYDEDLASFRGEDSRYVVAPRSTTVSAPYDFGVTKQNVPTNAQRNRKPGVLYAIYPLLTLGWLKAGFIQGELVRRRLVGDYRKHLPAHMREKLFFHRTWWAEENVVEAEAYLCEQLALYFARDRREYFMPDPLQYDRVDDLLDRLAADMGVSVYNPLENLS